MVLTMENLSVFHDWIEALLDSTQKTCAIIQVGPKWLSSWSFVDSRGHLFYQYSLVDLKGCFVNLTAAQTSDSQFFLPGKFLFTSILGRVL